MSHDKCCIKLTKTNTHKNEKRCTSLKITSESEVSQNKLVDSADWDLRSNIHLVIYTEKETNNLFYTSTPKQQVETIQKKAIPLSL